MRTTLIEIAVRTRKLFREKSKEEKDLIMLSIIEVSESILNHLCRKMKFIFYYVVMILQICKQANQYSNYYVSDRQY